MSGFTAGCQRQATTAWRAVVTCHGWFARKQQEGKQTDSLATRTGTGCLGFLMFGFVWIFIPLIVIVTVEAAIVA